jgi:hypothetical protein
VKDTEPVAHLYLEEGGALYHATVEKRIAEEINADDFATVEQLFDAIDRHGKSASGEWHRMPGRA